MIYELSRAQFETIEHLLKGKGVHEEVVNVVSGSSLGWVFVDNVMAPGTAMIWSEESKGLFFIGNPTSEEFNSALITYMKYILIPRMKKKNLEGIELYGTSKVWNKKLNAIFERVEVSIKPDATGQDRPSIACLVQENELVQNTKRAELEIVHDTPLYKLTL
jgi:hypothetical protein